MRTRLTSIQRVLCALTWAIVVMMIGLTALSWTTLPDQVPTHYNFAGEADAWGGKANVWLVPVVAGFACAVVEVCARLRPDHINVPVKIRPEFRMESYRVMRTMCFGLNVQIALTFFLIQLASLLNVPKLTQASFAVIFLMALTVALACLKVKRINQREA